MEQVYFQIQHLLQHQQYRQQQPIMLEQWAKAETLLGPKHLIIQAQFKLSRLQQRVIILLLFMELKGVMD
jgi:hypothetical protein